MSRKKGSLGERGVCRASTVRLTPALWSRLDLVAQCGGWSRAAAMENLLWTVLPGGNSDEIRKSQPPLSAREPAHTEQAGAETVAAVWYPRFGVSDWI